ncbi:MAG: C-terminal helicase domain-containing protein, partial [Conexivisphaera sp.]
RIEPHPTCSRIKLGIKPRGPLSYILDPERPAVFVHVEGQERAEGGSRWNEEELKVAEAIVRRLAELGVKRERVGVIAPYRAQRNRLSERLQGVEVGTVDAFQGREKDVIVFSATATTPRSVRFVENRRRLNVALTRARMKLIVLANANAPWAGLMREYIEYARQNEAYFAWKP